MKDLRLDNFDIVEIEMAVEEFAMDIPNKEADKIDSCSLAIDYTVSHPMAKSTQKEEYMQKIPLDPPFMGVMDNAEISKSM